MLTQQEIDALDEIGFLRRECLGLLADALAIHQPATAGAFPDALRNVVTPFLYSIWERCFTTGFAVMLRLLRTDCATASQLNSRQAALWLQSEPFLASFIDRTKNIRGEDDSTRKSVKRSAYINLQELLDQIDLWRAAPLNLSTDTASLVMTFSNVNLAVLDLNAHAIGLDQLAEFKSFRANVGRLEGLVGRRNDISHGALTTPPGNREFLELVDLTRDQLITEFCDVVQIWLLFR